MKMIYSLIVITLLMGCKGNTESEIKTAPSQANEHLDDTKKDLNETSSKEEIVFEDERFTQVYNAYLDLKASLVNTDQEASTHSTRAFFMITKGIDDFKEIFEETIPFVEATTIEQRRIIFSRVSLAVENQIAKEKIISGAIYKQYCPMAFNGKGAYWLSDSKEVRNPYFGDQMLKCGVVDSTIE